MNDLLLVAQVAGRRCAFCAISIRSVIEIGEITPIPGTPAMVLGLAALRSQTLTVIDCRLAIGEAAAELPTDARAAVVEVDGHPYALVVDSIEDIAETASEVDTVLGGFGERWARVARGMVETTSGPVLLLDINKMVDSPIQSHRAA
ncbi:MAG: chemotaxis protein CheW [Erythrobacter sp.]